MEAYKFQKLDVNQLAFNYVENVFELSGKLPQGERYKLCDKMEQAATALALNITEGTTGQMNPGLSKFLRNAFRAYMETVACLDLIEEYGFLPASDLSPLRKQGRHLFLKLAVFGNVLR